MIDTLKSAVDGLSTFAETAVPRILSQICRDSTSPCHGAGDRNWWHYKIRDFPSIILQQSGRCIYEAGKLETFEPHHEAFDNLAVASCHFWNLRACRHGSFEEYYPWENGYPPLAFSTLAVARLVCDGVVKVDEVESGLRIAAKQLLTRFEAEAVNQQIAGLAALGWIKQIMPNLVPGEAFDELTDRILSLQHEEGWFPEYGGPDIGYLSVVVDCLWELFDATGDDRFTNTIARAVRFISEFAALPSHGAGMHNSRNTDYIVPYGIVRAIRDLPEPGDRLLAAGTFSALYRDCASPHHFLHAIDDRYLCHYIGHSVIRAVGLLASEELMLDKNMFSELVPSSRTFSGAGYVIRSESIESFSALISTNKGGIISAWHKGMRFSNFGWQIVGKNRLWCSHWWSDGWQAEIGKKGIAVTGYMVPHRELVSSPIRHIILRCISFILGRRVIGILKKNMIFKKVKNEGPKLHRNIIFEAKAITVSDKITGIEEGMNLQRAPRASKRHVASADSFHAEDVALCEGWCMTENISRSGCDVAIETRYEISEKDI